MTDGSYILAPVTIPASGAVDCPHRDDADAWGLCRVVRWKVVYVAGFPVPTLYDASDWISWQHLPNYGPVTPDVDASGFVNADDYDLWMIGYIAGCPCADYDHNGFVNGDDADDFTEQFQAGTAP